MSIEAPAKLNLTLRVLGKRSDGFHELESIVIGVGLNDRITAALADSASITCSDPALSNERNLASVASRRLAQHLDRPHDVSLEVAKQIPVGGGLGGGSSDAAAAMLLCDQLWNYQLSKSELAEVGAAIGSDVPLFFHLPSAVMRGRGEILEPVSLSWKAWALLMIPPIGTSTADVYAAWRPEDSRSESTSPNDVIACTTANEMCSLLFNDLEPAALRRYPQIANLREELEPLSIGTVRLTGSGSTMFTLFDEYNEAASAAAKVSKHIENISTLVVEAPVAQGPVVSNE